MSEDRSSMPEKDGTDLSTDELEAVSGADRDWLTDGCAAAETLSSERRMIYDVR